MPNHLRLCLVGTAMLLAAGATGPANAADRPSGALRDRPLVLQERSETEVVERYGPWAGPPRPHGRPINGGPGYVGSDYGLGKPAYTGLGTRPDWGRSE